eukprot:8659359-Lingulodinium_polyedra.AAC.1
MSPMPRVSRSRGASSSCGAANPRHVRRPTASRSRRTSMVAAPVARWPRACPAGACRCPPRAKHRFSPSARSTRSARPSFSPASRRRSPRCSSVVAFSRASAS